MSPSLNKLLCAPALAGGSSREGTRVLCAALLGGGPVAGLHEVRESTELLEVLFLGFLSSAPAAGGAAGGTATASGVSSATRLVLDRDSHCVRHDMAGAAADSSSAITLFPKLMGSK